MPESGILASGAIVSLIDTASGASVWMTLGHFEPIVTIDLRLDYLRPGAQGRDVIAPLRMLQADPADRASSAASPTAATRDGRSRTAPRTFMLNP